MRLRPAERIRKRKILIYIEIDVSAQNFIQPMANLFEQIHFYVILIEKSPVRWPARLRDLHQGIKFVWCLIDIIMIIVYQITWVNEFPAQQQQRQRGARRSFRKQFDEKRAQANIGHTQPIFLPKAQTMDNNKANGKKRRKWDGNAQQQHHARGWWAEKIFSYFYTCKPPSSQSPVLFPSEFLIQSFGNYILEELSIKVLRLGSLMDMI